MEEWLKKQWHMNIMKYYTAIQIELIWKNFQTILTEKAAVTETIMIWSHFINLTMSNSPLGKWVCVCTHLSVFISAWCNAWEDMLLKLFSQQK